MAAVTLLVLSLLSCLRSGISAIGNLCITYRTGMSKDDCVQLRSHEGKKTQLNVLAGMVIPDKGSASFQGCCFIIRACNDTYSCQVAWITHVVVALSNPWHSSEQPKQSNRSFVAGLTETLQDNEIGDNSCLLKPLVISIHTLCSRSVSVHIG